jgi:hypothetical protein
MPKYQSISTTKDRPAKFLVIAVVGSAVLVIAMVAAGMLLMSGWGKMTPGLAERFFLEKHPGCTIVEYNRRGDSDGATYYVFKYRKSDEPGLYEEMGGFSWGDGVWVHGLDPTEKIRVITRRFSESQTGSSLCPDVDDGRREHLAGDGVNRCNHK